MRDDTRAAAGAGIGGLLLGILVGAVIGGVVTLLLTPRTGKETRELIAGKASQTGQMLKDRYSDVSGRVGRMKDAMLSSAKEEAEKVENEAR